MLGKLPKRTLLVATCLCVYALFGLAWLSLPGPQHDEVIFLNVALPASMGTHFLTQLNLFGWEVPSMLLPYVGALKGWIWAGLFLLWSPTIYSVRIPAVLLGGAALLLFYLWVRRHYPPPVAVLALALAAADPSYIYTARLDWGPVVLQHFLTFGGLLLGAKWYEALSKPGQICAAQRYLRLAGAGICFGLALWDKATCVWTLAALAISLLVLFPRQTLRCLRPVAVLVFLLALLLGAYPLVVYNIQQGDEGTVARVSLERLNREVLTNKFANLQDSLAGRSVYNLVGGWDDPLASQRYRGVTGKLLDTLSAFSQLFDNPFVYLVLLAIAALPFLAGHRRELLFPILMTALMWVQMMIAKDGGYSVHHYVLAYPLPHLAVAAAAGRIWMRGNRWWRRLMAAALAVLMVAQLSWDARYLRLFRENGGAGNWSDAIYEIAHFVEQQNPQPLVVMDWGFSNPIMFLTSGRVTMYEDHTASDIPPLAALLEQPNARFLLHAAGQEVYPGGRRLVEEVVPQQGARCQTVRNFFQRNGRMVATLLRCLPGADSRSAAEQ